MASLARNTFLRLSKSQWLAERLMRRPFALRAVKKFMPGEELSDALEAAAALAPFGLGVLLTKLGENLEAESEATAVRDHYLGVFDQIAARKLDAQVSVKATQLGLDFSPSHCADHLEVLAAKAEATGGGGEGGPICGSTWRTRAMWTGRSSCTAASAQSTPRWASRFRRTCVEPPTILLPCCPSGPRSDW